MNRLAWVDEELASLESSGLRRRLRARVGYLSAEIEIDGRTLINFGSNDYLGLAADPRLGRAVAVALEHEGWGSGASPLVCGRTALHEQLEARLAEFEGAEAALLFPSGFAANAGAIPALVGRGDAVYGDAKNHASIIDGCRLSRAKVHVYPHADCAALAELLQQGDNFRRRLIVTDSLFSMDGDLAPLVELADLAQRHDAMLMVDEAHATGVFGERGRGVAEHLGVEDCIDIRIGTLSKALGSAGGFVAGRRSLIDWLANRARSYVFSTAPPAAMCAAALTALDIIREEPFRRITLLARAEQLRSALRQQGWHVGNSACPILPILIGGPTRTIELANRLQSAGLFVPGIRPPSVPEGESLLRVSLCFGHTEAMIGRLTSTLEQAQLM